LISDEPNNTLKWRPAIVVLAGIIVGISVATLVPFQDSYVILGSLGLCAVLLVLSLFAAPSKVIKFVLVIVIAASLGFTASSVQQYDRSLSLLKKISSLHSKSAIVFGEIVSPRDSSAHSDRFVIKLDSLRIDSSVVRTDERMLLTIGRKNTVDGICLPRKRDKIKAYAELESLEGERNPFAISPGNALRKETGAVAAAYVKSLYDLYIIDSSAQRGLKDIIGGFFEHLNSGIINEALSSAINDTAARAIASAVVLGNKQGIDDQTTMAFRRAGLAHILVVSGFNVAIVAALIYYVLRLIGLYHLRPRIILSMIGVAFYAFIVGLEPSVFRALISVELVFLGLLIERKPDIGNITAAVACIALLVDPTLLFDPSFQLTYGAVFSLVFIQPRLAPLLPHRLKQSKGNAGKIFYYILSTLLSSASVTIGLLPIMIFHFHRLTVIGLFANIIGIPLAAILTVISFLLIPITLISNVLGVVYGDVTAILANILVWLANVSSSFSWSSPIIQQPNVLFVIVYFIVVSLLLVSRSVKQFFVRLVMASCLTTLILVINIPLFSPLVAKNDLLSILFLDVGQGDAALIHTPNNKTYLIDFGGVSKEGAPIAERQITPLLEADGMSTIDAGFISHMHIDHYGGLQQLIGGGYIKHIYTSGERSETTSAYELDSAVLCKHIPVTKLQRGDTIMLDRDVTCYVLNPDTASAVSGSEMNHHSLVLKICYGNTSALFLGDIESSDERALADHYGSFLRSDIVKVAHHGSQYSSSPQFTERIQAKYALVSVGEHNYFGHPTAAALSHWYWSGSEVHRTDREGAVLFRSDGKHVWLEDWK
jgi:competence protein ComEC